MRFSFTRPDRSSRKKVKSPVANAGERTKVVWLAESRFWPGVTKAGAWNSSAANTCAEDGQLSLGPGATVTRAACAVARIKLAYTGTIVAV